MIYFIHKPNERSIKVGYSADPWKRLRELQTASPSPLYLLGAIPGDRKGETAWKRHFQSIRLGGEWFKEGPVFDCFRERLIAHSIVRLREMDWDGTIKPYLKPIRETTPNEALQCLISIENETSPYPVIAALYREFFADIQGPDSNAASGSWTTANR